MEHRKSRLSIYFKGPRILGTGNEHCLRLKSAAALAPNKTVNLSSEALKPGIDFSSLAMEVLDGVYLDQKVVLSTLKIFV